MGPEKGPANGQITVDAWVLDSSAYGATTADEIRWPTPAPRTRVLGDVLIPPGDQSLRWFTRATKGWPFAQWDTQSAAEPAQTTLPCLFPFGVRVSDWIHRHRLTRL